MIPGEIITAADPITVNDTLPVTMVAIENTGLVTVQLTAHFHVFEANPCLRFDRRKAYGMRIDTHAKGAVRIPPGATRDVNLVPIGGRRVVHGFNGAINGRLDDVDPDTALADLIRRGFLHEADHSP